MYHQQLTIIRVCLKSSYSKQANSYAYDVLLTALHSLWYHHTYTQPLVSSHLYTASGIITPIGLMIPEAV